MYKTLEVLAVTMNADSRSLVEKMNIQSDALIGNQADRYETEEYTYNGCRIKCFTTNERGVGLNRNNILMRATADIVLFADDDVVYDDGYKDMVLSAFNEHPKADVIIFNVVPIPESINPCLITKWKKIGMLNCLKYGAVRIAAKRSAMQECNVYFSLLFGGGARFSAGEDSLFLADLVKKKLKVYAYPQKIGNVYFETSSWFVGFNEKYFKDKGIFFYFLSKRFSFLLCLQYVVRCRHLFKEYCKPKKALKLMLEGIKEYKNERKA